MTSAGEITICTVVTPLHWRLMALNRDLIRALNPGAAIKWNIVDNKLREPAPDAGDVHAHFPDIALIEGADLLEGVAPKSFGSYQHAAGLNKAMERVTTRYVLVLDPDFYVVRSTWIADTLAHMRDSNLALFGAPWNPRWHHKYRYFPCSHFMLIDLEQLPWRADLFAPDVAATAPKFASSYWRALAEAERAGPGPLIAGVLRAPHRALWHDIKQRREIGRSPDTGYRLQAEFAQHPDLKLDLVQPVFDPDVEGFEPAVVSRAQFGAPVQALMPDAWAYAPKRAGYFAREGFRAYGLPDTRPLRWEEFLWRDAPFGFHVRGELQRAAFGAIDTAEVAITLNEVAAKQGLAPIAPVAAPKPALDIIVCTYNRAEALDGALASIPADAIDHLDLGVLVVDNNSTDGTQAIIAKHADRLPFLRSVKEVRQGLSHARNHGLRETSRVHVLFLDDDAALPRTYAHDVSAALRRFNPDFFGGPVLPAFEREPPEWFDVAFETRRYETRAGLSRSVGISGSNFGIARAVIERLGGFAGELGMSGATMAFGEDRELLERYRARTPADAQRVYYGPELGVRHAVSESKLRFGYQVRRQYEMARSREQIFVMSGKRSPARAIALALAHIALAPPIALWRVLECGLHPRGWFRAATHLSAVAGRAAGAFAASPRAETPALQNSVSL